jgi:hypothetical protein
MGTHTPGLRLHASSKPLGDGARGNVNTPVRGPMGAIGPQYFEVKHPKESQHESHGYGEGDSVQGHVLQLWNAAHEAIRHSKLLSLLACQEPA